MSCSFGIITSNATDKLQHWINVNKHLQKTDLTNLQKLWTLFHEYTHVPYQHVWVTVSPLSPSEVHPYPTGDAGTLTSWDPVLLPAAGEAAPTSLAAPHELWVFVCSSLSESRQLLAWLWSFSVWWWWFSSLLRWLVRGDSFHAF